MRHWRTVLALVLTLGLASPPFPVHAQEDEGSMSEHEARDPQGKQVREGIKQEPSAKGEAKKDVMDQEASRAHPDSHDGHNESHEQMEERSH